MIGSAQAVDTPARPSGGRSASDDQLGDRRALARFAEHVALTGVSIKEGRRVIYAGWDRKRGRRVRVIVEEVER